MEDEKACAGSSSRVQQCPPTVDLPVASPPHPQASTAPAPAAAPPPKPKKNAPSSGQRQTFAVELRPGETTIVSWKKLLRESGYGNGDVSVPVKNNLAPEARPVSAVRPGEDDLKHTLQPPNCFSAVIEKIERLYTGKESSDEEELDELPDDDQYDTEDSFIDDTELDEYFQVDKLATKHSGYFVNRGKLEWVEPTSSPNLAPKKRRRKDSAKIQSEKVHIHDSNEHVNMSNMKIKAAARNAPLVAKKLAPPKVIASQDIPPSAKVPNKDVSPVRTESKYFDKNRVLTYKDLYKSSGTCELFDATYEISREKAAASQVEPHSKKKFNVENEVGPSTKIQHKDRCGTGEYSQMSTGILYPTQVVQPMSHRAREGSLRPKGTTIERAIRDLEKIVALSRPPNPVIQEVDPSVQGVKRRLPQEVKPKLAKVARLAASHGKISEDLIDRLMGIVGHLVQRKTLQRNMREMVELGLSAKQQKADKFLQIKREVNEMIKARVSLLKSKVPDLPDSSDDFQDVVGNDEKRALKGKYSMDISLEDKICDLYDLYVEGMDEDKGPQSRKLYAELAELWPAGYMDNLGIKDAIYRAKERRRHKIRHEERIERKKLSLAVKAELQPSLHSYYQQTGHDRHSNDPGLQLSAQDRPIPNLNPPFQGTMNDCAPYLSDSAQQYGYAGSKHHEKARGSVSDDGNKAAAVDVKKKTKRKPETDLGDFRANPQKIRAPPSKERQNSNIILDDLNQKFQQAKLVLQAAAATSDQPT
ncbi:hypothetical protein AXF42_Ash016781 [Apostasia shenzhenica]|uniref:Hpc2-related domain-containing protein n=1 Tax=Apostasia shenzhenica TaxID=1088818 RepID=A0A2I0BAD4_9ASPA|nr:hypothetical protein AXF42_Ash016781 [Apostasia shenzhenica]